MYVTKKNCVSVNNQVPFCTSSVIINTSSINFSGLWIICFVAFGIICWILHLICVQLRIRTKNIENNIDNDIFEPLI